MGEPQGGVARCPLRQPQAVGSMRFLCVPSTKRAVGEACEAGSREGAQCQLGKTILLSR